MRRNTTFLNIFRHKGYDNFQAHGAYGMFRAQLIGDGYCYNMADGGVATQGKGTLELVAGYNYTNHKPRLRFQK